MAAPARPAGRYGVLLLLLISTYLLIAFTSSRLAERLSIALFAAVLLLGLRNSPLSRRRTILLGAAAVAGSLAAGVAAVTSPGTGTGIAGIWNGLMLLLSAVFIVRRVLARPTVTLQSIYGALSAYLIVGLMFATFYAAIDHLDGAQFFADGQMANTQTFQYFSFTTLTTLGYGDFTAAGNDGRAVAVIEALVGQGVSGHPGGPPRRRVPWASRAGANRRAQALASARHRPARRHAAVPPRTVRATATGQARRPLAGTGNHPAWVMPALAPGPHTASQDGIIRRSGIRTYGRSGTRRS
jgi:hypothetical protein